jgi:hypothetical protein
MLATILPLQCVAALSHDIDKINRQMLSLPQGRVHARIRCPWTIVTDFGPKWAHNYQQQLWTLTAALSVTLSRHVYTAQETAHHRAQQTIRGNIPTSAVNTIYNIFLHTYTHSGQSGPYVIIYIIIYRITLPHTAQKENKTAQNRVMKLQKPNYM